MNESILSKNELVLMKDESILSKNEPVLMKTELGL